ncbi:MAG TPA: MFS transporter, partial [candidate division Zixibacteria bacterium]|nr:MFS transporter [candidate division Zixibacteria bacterium]
MNTTPPPRGFSALKNTNIRWAATGSAFFTFGNRALQIVIAFQIYQITHTALALGFLGLSEAIPAIIVAPFGGHVADNFNRQNIIRTTRAICLICALVLAFLSWHAASIPVVLFYLVIFIWGFARGFTDPAMTAFESQIVPRDLIINAASWFGSISITSSILGQAASGFIFDGYGATVSYLVTAACFLVSFICVTAISPAAQVKQDKDERVWASIKIGWKALYHIQPLFAAMALDMIAVLFGGMTILLPIFANDILKIGAGGYGLLNATISLGALSSMVLAMTYSPIKKAGRNILFCVAAFGVCIIVFAFSKNLYLSVAMLFLSGFFDGISMIIRRAMTRLLSPDQLRGRIAAANSIFITASNELGA